MTINKERQTFIKKNKEKKLKKIMILSNYTSQLV